MVETKALCIRDIEMEEGTLTGYYARSLFYHDTGVVDRLNRMSHPIETDRDRTAAWVDRYCAGISGHPLPQSFPYLTNLKCPLWTRSRLFTEYAVYKVGRSTELRNRDFCSAHHFGQFRINLVILSSPAVVNQNQGMS